MYQQRNKRTQLIISYQKLLCNVSTFSSDSKSDWRSCMGGGKVAQKAGRKMIL